MSPASLPFDRLLSGRRLVGGALSFVQVMRELDLAEVRRQVDQPVRVLVAAEAVESARLVAGAAFGDDVQTRWSLAVVPLAEADLARERPDMLVLVVSEGQDPFKLLSRLATGPASNGPPVLVISLGDSRWLEQSPPRRLTGGLLLVNCPGASPAQVATVVPPAALELLPDLELALGRRFPPFRAAVAERLIGETSRVNGQFALISSLPANLPLVGGAAAGLADLAVLTKNQGVLVYKLAGLHGRDLSEHLALAIEIAPVVGGAFFWRSVARTLVGLLPGIVGALPKAAIAYAGTFAVGQMARYYYSTGKRPPPELVARFQTEGARLAAQFTSHLKEWRERRLKP